MERDPSACLCREGTFACRLESHMYSTRRLWSNLLLKLFWGVGKESSSKNLCVPQSMRRVVSVLQRGNCVCLG